MSDLRVTSPFRCVDSIALQAEREINVAKTARMRKSYEGWFENLTVRSSQQMTRASMKGKEPAITQMDVGTQMYNRIHALLVFVLWLALVTFPTGGAGYPQGSVNDSTNGQIGAPIMWREPTDIEHRDLFYGIGGKENAPDPIGCLQARPPDQDGNTAQNHCCG